MHEGRLAVSPQFCRQEADRASIEEVNMLHGIMIMTKCTYLKSIVDQQCYAVHEYRITFWPEL